MGTPYGSLVGQPPAPNTLQFPDWWGNPSTGLIVKRVANCTFNGTTFYLSNSTGSDSGLGTIGSPWKTVQKAQSVAQASSGNILFRFLRGDKWPIVPSGVGPLQVIGIPFLFFGEYGSVGLNNPLFTTYTLQYNSGWTQDGSTNHWYRSESNTIGNVRLQSNPLGQCFIRLNSVATVITTPYSWYWDGVELHINPGNDIFGPRNPNSFPGLLEACIQNQSPGIWPAGCPFVRVQNIRLDGWGCDWTSAQYSFRLQQNPNEEGVIIGLETYYGGYHLTGQLDNGGTGQGGIGTWLFCRRGYSNVFQGGSSNHITYASNGGSESIQYGCSDAYGALPDYTWYNSSTRPRAGSNFYAHSGNSTPHSLLLAAECEIENNSFGCGSPGFYDAAPSASGLSQIRAFILGERMLGWQPLDPQGSINFAHTNTLRFGCHYQIRPPANVPDGLSTLQNSGWAAFNILQWDAINQTSNVACLFDQSNPHAPSFRSNHIEILNCDTGAGIINPSRDPSVWCPNASAINNIFSFLGWPTFGFNSVGVNFPNSSTNLKGNAYYGVTTRTGTGSGTGPAGYDQDANKVELGVRVPPGVRPLPTSPLNLMAVIPPEGQWQYDRNYRNFSTVLGQSIGSEVERGYDSTPSTPTLSTTTLSPASYQATVGGDAGVGIVIAHAQLPNGSVVIDGVVTGSGSLTISAGLSPNGSYIALAVATNGYRNSSTIFSVAGLPAGGSMLVTNNGNFSLTQGFDYAALDNNSIDFTDPLGLWPDLTSATVVIDLIPVGTAGLYQATNQFTLSVITASGTSKKVRWEPTRTQTAALGVWDYRWRIIATLASGHKSDLGLGICYVNQL